MNGKVYLVGAGPGHPGLITLRGAECLQRADAVLYDYLCNTQILSHAGPNAELICLGQHRRADVWPQTAINNELVKRAIQGQIVVRLKGGDPIIFGRAAEELGALVEHDIPFEIVPGITAATAAGAYLGLPLTDRQNASAVALVTAQEWPGKAGSTLDYPALASFPGTLVLYMGVTTAPEWTRSLMDAGKPADTPAMIVRRCSLPDQMSIRCTLGQVAEQLTPRNRIPPPVIVIVGSIAKCDDELAWFQRLPLFGQSVMVTRPRHQAAQLAGRLTELGAEVIAHPAIEISPPDDWQPVDDSLENLQAYDAVVFSSSNGVRHFLGRLLSKDRDMRALANIQIAVIGPGTAETLSQFHVSADVQPDTYRAEALVAALVPTAAGRRFLLVRGSRGREILADELRLAGGQVQQVVAYRSTDVEAADGRIAQRLRDGQIDWTTVTSSAIARSLASMFGEDLRKTRLASISPVTSQTLRQIGFEPAAEASEYTISGTIAEIVRCSSEGQRG